jgi:hypothetical protein
VRIYLGGGTGFRTRELNALKHIENRLLSFYEIEYDKNDQHFQKGCFKLLIERRRDVKNRKVSLFLDSGAFGAWTHGQTIDIDKYIEFIKKNEDCIEIYANLDVIGNAQATWDNQKYMEKAGLHPLPVVHTAREDPKWIRRYLRAGYDYIGLGGIAKAATRRALVQLLDEFFSLNICDDKGMPKVKVHGFGVSSPLMMFRYPWYSVDSTTWVMTSRHGFIFIPNRRGGKWQYDLSPGHEDNLLKIPMSSRSPTTKDKDKHIYNRPPTIQRLCLDYLEEKGYVLGKSEFKDVEERYKLKDNERWNGKTKNNGMREVEVIVEPGVTNIYQQRDEMNIIYFVDLEKSMPKWPWAFKKKSVPRYDPRFREE